MPVTPSPLVGRLGGGDDGEQPQPGGKARMAGPGPPAPLTVRHLTVSYEARPVLRSVSFSVPRGELVGIVGPNGAGKSTLLKAILGLLKPDTGQVLIFGQPIQTCRHRVAYVPQTEAVDWDFPVTVAEVVLMGRYSHMGLFRRPSRSDRDDAAHALELVGMTEFANRHIRHLSGGQQQRVFIARALCQHADVLLLDEPFTGVDAATEQAIFTLINELRAQGRTLLVVNHDLSVLEKFGMLMLLNQRIVAFGPVKQVLTDENLKRTYGGRLSLLERADTELQPPG
ncbi:MAG: metal ABC transporter ATP-binding protein [Phycisphaeraceae bacterium]